MMRTMAYQDADTRLSGRLFVPATASERRGVMVVHGGAGLDEHAERRASKFADLGYATFACDMYGEGVAGDRGRIMARINELRTNRSMLVRRATAGLDVLSAHVTGPIAVVGYCLGGLVVLELARAGVPLAAAVSVHGSLSTSERAQPGAIGAPILVCHGALDPHSPMTDVSSFVDEMNAAGADWQLQIYGGAMHGFTHEHATGQTPGVKYDRVADTRSAQAIASFLAEAFAIDQCSAS